MARHGRGGRRSGTGRSGTGRGGAGGPALHVRGPRSYVAVELPRGRDAWSQAGTATAQVYDWLRERGVAPAGPALVRVHRTGPDGEPTWAEAGIPVAAPVPADGRLVSGTIPGGAYATLVHEGRPEGLAGTRAKLAAWLEREGHRVRARVEDDVHVRDGHVERFLEDPGPNPDRWTIEVALLLDVP